MRCLHSDVIVRVGCKARHDILPGIPGQRHCVDWGVGAGVQAEAELEAVKQAGGRRIPGDLEGGCGHLRDGKILN